MGLAGSFRGLAVVGIVGLVELGGVAQAIPASIIEGTWLTVSKSEITIAPCEAVFCGQISTIVVPAEITAKYGDDLEAIGSNYTDVMNKDPALRERPILGMQILTLRPGATPWVFDGEIYNPQDGNIYSGYVEVLGADKLKLNGCVLYNLICSGEEWVRVIPPPETEADAGPLVAPVPAAAPVR